jgi:hypothetical protein
MTGHPSKDLELEDIIELVKEAVKGRLDEDRRLQIALRPPARVDGPPY